MKGSDIWAIVTHAILALIGGSAREVSHINGKKFVLSAFLGGILVSAFSGMVVFFICRNFELNTWLTAALTSVAGYGGINALDFVVTMIKDKIKNS